MSKIQNILWDRRLWRGSERKGLTLEQPKTFRSITGKGIEAVLGRIEYYIGNKKLCEKLDINLGKSEEQAQVIAEKGQTPMFVIADKK